MTTGPSTTETPKRRVPRPLLIAATTALVVATGAGVAGATAFAAPPSPTPTPTATSSETPSDAPARKGHRRGPLRGEFVVPARDGGYMTVAIQYGEVTAVSQDSVTVKSDDGHSREYKVTPDTRINRGDTGIDAIKTGQQVRVAAKVEGDTATAKSVRDVSKRGKHHNGHPGHRPPAS